MSFTKLYIGDKEDLAMMLNEDVINFTFTVVDSDGNNYSFTGFTDFNLNIWEHEGGDLLETLVNTTNITVSSNVVTLNVDYSAHMAAITKSGIYYYKLTYNDASSRVITISFGDLKIV